MNQQDLKASSGNDTTFEFELKAEGVDISSGVVTFVIKNDDFNYEINCKSTSANQYAATVPKKLKLIGSKEYVVRIVAEGFLFEPAGGNIRFVDSEAVTSTPIKTQGAPAKTTESAPITPKIETKPEPKVITVNKDDAGKRFTFDSIDVEEAINNSKKTQEPASALDDVMVSKPTESSLSKEEAQSRINQILEDERIKRVAAEQTRRDAEKVELANRQREIIEQQEQVRAKQAKVKEITREFT